jgi:hypothetical protein
MRQARLWILIACECVLAAVAMALFVDANSNPWRVASPLVQEIHENLKPGLTFEETTRYLDSLNAKWYRSSVNPKVQAYVDPSRRIPKLLFLLCSDVVIDVYLNDQDYLEHADTRFICL